MCLRVLSNEYKARPAFILQQNASINERDDVVLQCDFVLPVVLVLH